MPFEPSVTPSKRDCTDCYIAEYMHGHLGEEFEGIITSVTEFGFYVELPNTVEGLVMTESIPGGPYEFDGRFSLTQNSKKTYSIGDRVKVICAAANVPSGKIDFTVCKE